MSIVFITYGNMAYSQSKHRIIKEAQCLDIFDKIVAYGPENLSEEVTKNPLFQYKKGGGYWIWKSYIIKKTLQNMNDGDILVYCDAGCSLYRSNLWNKYFSYLDKKSILAFKINCLNYQYVKSKVVNEFKKFNGKYWHYSYQIAATVIFLKKDNFTMNFINEWWHYCIPDFILDVSPQDLYLEDKRFIDHRHDQAVFTALIYKYIKTCNIKLKWNDFEAKRNGQAIRATRISNLNKRSNERESIIKNFLRHNIVLPWRDLKHFFWSLKNEL